MDKIRSTLEKGATFVKNNPQLILNIKRVECYNDDPQLYEYISYFRDNYDNTLHNSSYAIGASFNRNRALLRLFGELIERQSLGNTMKGKLVHKNYESIKNISINPRQIMYFSKEEKKLLKKVFIYNKSSKLHWIKGFSLISNKEIYIPAQLVFIPYSFEDSEPTLQFLNSTGAAAGSSMEEAIYNGICEIIERDSFMICYLNKLPMPSISVNNFSKKLNQIVNLINRYDLKLYLINLTTDINIFSVGALIVDKTGKGPALSMGLKAGLEIEEVIIGAIEESLMVRSWARNSFIANKNKDKLFWSNKKNLRYLDFWLNNKEIVFKNKKIAKITIKEKLNKVIEIFKKKNLDLLFVDIASLEIKKLGFSVVKVIIPTLQPMYHDKDFKYLGNKRLYNAPLNMKMLKKSLSRSKMNKIPHPLL